MYMLRELLQTINMITYTGQVLSKLPIHAHFCSVPDLGKLISGCCSAVSLSSTPACRNAMWPLSYVSTRTYDTATAYEKGTPHTGSQAAKASLQPTRRWGSGNDSSIGDTEQGSSRAAALGRKYAPTTSQSRPDAAACLNRALLWAYCWAVLLSTCLAASRLARTRTRWHIPNIAEDHP